MQSSNTDHLVSTSTASWEHNLYGRRGRGCTNRDNSRVVFHLGVTRGRGVPLFGTRRGGRSLLHIASNRLTQWGRKLALKVELCISLYIVQRRLVGSTFWLEESSSCIPPRAPSEHWGERACGAERKLEQEQEDIASNIPYIPC